MGCGASRFPVRVLPTATSGASSRPMAIAVAKPAAKFSGVKVGLELLYLDSFRSKVSGEVLQKWRPAQVRVFDGYSKTSKLELHFVGWSSKYDKWVDLNRDEDLACLAPEALLSPEQIENGEPMDEYQLGVALSFLMTGDFAAPQSPSSVSSASPTSRHSNSSSNSPANNSASTNASYAVGQRVDVQDVLFKAGSGALHWRVAEVIEKTGTKLRLHFQGWDAVPWDEVIDLVKDGHRVRPVGTMTSLQRQSMMRKAHSSVNPRRRRTFDADPTKADASTPKYTDQDDDDGNGNDDVEESARDGGGGSSVSPLLLLANRQAPSATTKPATTKPSFSRFARDAKHARGIVPLSRTHRRHSSSGLESGQAFNARTMSKEVAFCDRMEGIGLHVVQMEEDGNCLFRAVAHQLYLDPSRHLELRKACVEHMAQHAARFRVFSTTNFPHHLKRMAIDGTWAAELEVRALEELADRVFSIYSSDSIESRPQPLHTNFDERQTLGDVETVNLSYHGNHYNSVFDQRHALPLPPRDSRLLVEARMRLFEAATSAGSASAQ